MNYKVEVLKKYPKALSLQGHIWMIYDRPNPPIVQIGRGNPEETAWKNAYENMKSGIIGKKLNECPRDEFAPGPEGDKRYHDQFAIRKQMDKEKMAKLRSMKETLDPAMRQRLEHEIELLRKMIDSPNKLKSVAQKKEYERQLRQKEITLALYDKSWEEKMKAGPKYESTMVIPKGATLKAKGIPVKVKEPTAVQTTPPNEKIIRKTVDEEVKILPKGTIVNVEGGSGLPASLEKDTPADGDWKLMKKIADGPQAVGEGMQPHKFNVYSADGESHMKEGMSFKEVRRMEPKAIKITAEGMLKMLEGMKLPTDRITPLATQRKWEDLTDKHNRKFAGWKAEDKAVKLLYNHDLFFGIEKSANGKMDLIWNYPLGVHPSYAVSIKQEDFDAIQKDPVRWLVERLGLEKSYKYLTQRVKSKSFWDSKPVRDTFASLKSNGEEESVEEGFSFNKAKKVAGEKSFYNNPNYMLGYRWAKENLELIERVVNKYGNTNFQKYIINNTIDFNQTDWNYFLNQFSKKYIAHIQFVLKNGGKYTPLQLLYYRNDKSGYLKEPLDWALEYAAYKHDPEKYTAYYAKTMGFYGLPKEEAALRLKKYIETKIAPKLVNKEWA